MKAVLEKRTDCDIIDSICTCGHSAAEHASVVIGPGGAVTFEDGVGNGECQHRNCWCYQYDFSHNVLAEPGSGKK